MIIIRKFIVNELASYALNCLELRLTLVGGAMYGGQVMEVLFRALPLAAPTPSE